MKKRLLFLGLCFLLLGPPAGSEGPHVAVEIDKDEVVLGDFIRMVITVEGKTPQSAPELPDIPGFGIRYLGSSTTSFTSVTVIVQGRRVEEKRSVGGTQFEYALTPKKLGAFTIPRFPFMIDGERYETSGSYAIRVIDLPEREEDLFLKVSADREAVYLGESVLLTFEWFFDEDIQNYSLQIPWFGALKDFLVEDLEPDPNAKAVQLIVNDREKVTAEKKSVLLQGRRYTVLRFQKVLTPITPGSYTLEPAFLRADVVKGYEEGRRSRIPFFRYYFDFSDDFFGLGKRAVTEQVLTRSKAVLLTVNPLPEAGRPPSFTGAVGQFDFQVTLSPQRVQKGEPVTVLLKVIGSGNFDEVQLPDFPELSAFKGYTPEVKTDTSRSDGMRIGEKTFTKVLVGRREGKYEIPPLSFSFFDPEKGTYQTISRGPFPIEVTPGTAPEDVVILTPPEPEPRRRGKEIAVISRDIRYIKTDLGMLGKKIPPLYRIPLFWIFGFVPFPLVTTLSFLIQRRRMKFQTDIGYARKTHAFKKAQKALAEATPFLDRGEVGPFYSGVSKALTQFLADKLNHPPGALPQELVETLKVKGIERSLLEELAVYFGRLDVAKYSSARAGKEEMREMWEKGRNLFIRLERSLR